MGFRMRWSSIARTGNSESSNNNWHSPFKRLHIFLRCAIEAAPPATWRY